MKKLIAMLFALIMVLLLAACGDNGATSKSTEDTVTTEATTAEMPTTTETPTTTEEPSTTEEPLVTYQLGETVSTNLWEFTLNNAEFAFYASSSNGSALEKANNKCLTANTGKSFVCMNFTIKNLDRGDLRLAGSSNSADYWSWNEFYAIYKGERYNLTSGVHNDGKTRLNNGNSFMIGKSGSGHYNEGLTAVLSSGKTQNTNAVGRIEMEPDSLTDGFLLEISILNADGELERFVYEVK